MLINLLLLHNGIRDFLLAQPFTWLQVIGIMQAIMVTLNYTLASLVSKGHRQADTDSPMWFCGCSRRSLTEVETEYVDMAESVPIQKLTLQEIKTATEVDAELQALVPIITQGWLERKAEVPSQLHAYFPFGEELSIQDGAGFKGERIVVLSNLRQCMMDKVHASHLGIQGCLRRAKEAFYWPGIFKQITEFIARCSICNSYKQEQQKKPLKCHKIPERPRQGISADLFDFNGTQYLITTDHYSNFFKLDILTPTSTRAVINKLKPHLARYGLPDRLTTDNRPQLYCAEFQKFASEYQFQHVKTSPCYP